MLRRWFLMVLCFFMLILLANPVQTQALSQSQIDGKGAVLIDEITGQVLFDKNKDQKLPPASITKILTAIIAIESGKLDQTVMIGTNPPRIEGTRVYLEEGEEIKLRDLVKASLIHSANDAALAIAEYLAESQEEFAVSMNSKAKEIGAINSNFVNSHGLTADNHYTTAYDIALIARYAMKNDEFRDIVKAKVLDWTGKAWQTRLINKNDLLWSYDGATGIKTGYTSEAKCTIVASATRDNKSYIVAVLGSVGTNTWKDAKNILDYGFDNFQTIQLASSSEIVATVNVDGDNKLNLVPNKNLAISLPLEGNQKMETKVVLDPLQSSISKGEILGKMVFVVDDIEVGCVDLIANNNINSWKIFDTIIYLVAILYFLQIVWRIFKLHRRKRKNSFSFGNYSSKY
ncbi:MAG: D-alanyl-D-alanine carboxypeptidase [Clostridia bacterium]|nr:D-alanyl-D-alanine carboxypeptidase [Clostridia bacterium]MDD4047942.1 D-alanyl-D-alanine carboxypeptidase [Clostridia bacterium]